MTKAELCAVHSINFLWLNAECVCVKVVKNQAELTHCSSLQEQTAAVTQIAVSCDRTRKRETTKTPTGPSSRCVTWLPQLLFVCGLFFAIDNLTWMTIRSSAQGNWSAKSLAGNVIDSSLSSLSSAGGGSRGQGGPGVGDLRVGVQGQGVGEGEGLRGRGQGTFHPPCHILYYHMVHRPKGTSHNKDFKPWWSFLLHSVRKGSKLMCVKKTVEKSISTVVFFAFRVHHKKSCSWFSVDLLQFTFPWCKVSNLCGNSHVHLYVHRCTHSTVFGEPMHVSANHFTLTPALLRTTSWRRARLARLHFRRRSVTSARYAPLGAPPLSELRGAGPLRVIASSCNPFRCGKESTEAARTKKILWKYLYNISRFLFLSTNMPYAVMVQNITSRICTSIVKSLCKTGKSQCHIEWQITVIFALTNPLWGNFDRINRNKIQ